MLVPWMHPVELEQFKWTLEAQPKRCLEWGSGGSTLVILEQPSVEQLVSIDHDAEWVKRVQAEISDPRLDLRYVPADVHGEDERPGSEWAIRAETDPELLRSYVELPTGEFDFVFVDGRARRFCLLRGYELLRSNGHIA